MKTIRYAFVRSLPIMAGYIVLGLGFGVLLQSKSYGAGWALVMSGLIYAGSMQYVAIDGQRAASVLRNFDAGTL